MKDYDVIMLDIKRMPALLQALLTTDMNVEQITDKHARLLGVTWEHLGFIVTLLTPHALSYSPSYFSYCSDNWLDKGHQARLKSVISKYSHTEQLPICVSVRRPHEYGYDSQSNAELRHIVLNAVAEVASSLLDVFGGVVLAEDDNQVIGRIPQTEKVISLKSLIEERLLCMGWNN